MRIERPNDAVVFNIPEYRVEGDLKVTGDARYTADFRLPGMLHARFLLSPFAYARIVSVDARAALSIPGVHAVLSGADVRPARFGRQLLDWPVLAWDRVRFIGDRVAAVAAESREIAEEATLAIKVDYEELTPVLTPAEALAPDAPILHPSGESAAYHMMAGTRQPVPHPNVQGYQVVTKGVPDIEVAFGQASRVFEHTFATPRQHQGHIEPHACVVWLDDNGVVRVVSNNKGPFTLRAMMAATLGLPVEQIVVDSGFVGGDFGGKGLSFDEFACYYLARATGRPVRAVMTYVEELMAANPRHAATIRLRSGVNTEGRFVAHEAEVILDGGAYAAGKPLASLVLSGASIGFAPYYVPNTRLVVQSVYTNTVPCGHMRSPGEVQSRFAGESHVDMIASELGIDALAFRLQNAITEGQLGPAGERYRDARTVEVLEVLRHESDWSRPRGQNRGRGVSIGVRPLHGGRASARFQLLPDGSIDVAISTPDQGAGVQRVATRVAAATLSISPDLIRVSRATTDRELFDSGVGGSRSTWVVGQAVLEGATLFLKQLEEVAAATTPIPADKWNVADLIRLIAAGGREVQVSTTYQSPVHGPGDINDYSFSGYVCEVEVDRHTGTVKVMDVLLVADVGTVIDPTAHQGQLEGGFAFGLGAALMEELIIVDGQVGTVSLGDYKLPTQPDMPASFRAVLLPASHGPGPFGAKMVGELSNAGVAPAIANAVFDAIGVRILTLPITAEKVFRELTPGGLDG